jgi:hypothetical protein
MLAASSVVFDNTNAAHCACQNEGILLSRKRLEILLRAVGGGELKVAHEAVRVGRLSIMDCSAHCHLASSQVTKGR